MSKSTLIDIARHFCLSDIASATIPATRLSNILNSVHRGRPLTALSLKYLQDQNLIGLQLLATGQIQYETFVTVAGIERQARQQAAAIEREAAEIERQTKAAELAARRWSGQQNTSASARRRNSPARRARAIPST